MVGENKTKKILIDKLNLIVTKYEKLSLDTTNYQLLLSLIKDDKWLDEAAGLIQKVENLEKIFDVSKEISKEKNDRKIDEMFAEYDVASRLMNVRFFGSFSQAEYIPTIVQ